MATIKITTTLKAMPKLSPSILSNYVTKEELEAKDYVTDVVDDGTYGRQKGTWVELKEETQKQSTDTK